MSDDSHFLSQADFDDCIEDLSGRDAKALLLHDQYLRERLDDPGPLDLLQALTTSLGWAMNHVVFTQEGHNVHDAVRFNKDHAMAASVLMQALEYDA